MHDACSGHPVRRCLEQGSAGQAFTHDHPGKMHHTNTGLGSLAQCQEVIRDQSRAMSHGGAGTIGPIQLPEIVALRRAPMQGR
ncbi:hypothetical protein D3C76_1631990 [compost metagenome]